MHRALAARVADFKRKFRKDPAGFDIDAFSGFLVHWAHVHIGREDRKILPFVASLARDHAA